MNTSYLTVQGRPLFFVLRSIFVTHDNVPNITYTYNSLNENTFQKQKSQFSRLVTKRKQMMYRYVHFV